MKKLKCTFLKLLLIFTVMLNSFPLSEFSASADVVPLTVDTTKTKVNCTNFRAINDYVGAISSDTSSYDVLISNNATNISVGVSKIYFTLSENVDPNTVSDVTVTLVKNVTTPTVGAIPVPCGAQVETDTSYTYNTGATDPNNPSNYTAVTRQYVVVKVGELEYGTNYTITLTSGIKSQDDTKSLVPSSLSFTTKTLDNQYYLNDSFEGYANNSVPSNFFVTPIPVPTTAPAYYYQVTGTNPSGGYAGDVKYTQDSNGSGYLDVKTLTTANGTREDGYYYFPTKNNAPVSANNGLKTEVEFETRVKFAAGSTDQVNLFSEGGHRSMDGLRKTNAGLYVTSNYPTLGSNNSAPYVIGSATANSLDPTKFYKVKEVYRLDSYKRYVVDFYIDLEDGNGYKLVQEGMRTGNNTPYGSEDKQSANISNMRLFSMNYGTNNTETVFDYFKIYDHIPALILSSSIRNNQDSVSTNTPSVSFVFGRDMRAASFTGNVSLKNNATSAVTQLSGTYDAATRTFTADLPRGTLAGLTNYTITIDKSKGKVVTTDGYKLEDDNQITFTTAEAVPELYVSNVSVLNGIQKNIITNNASNISTGVGAITFEMSEEIDSSTVNNTNCIITKSDGTPFSYGVELDNNHQIKFNFGRLDDNTGYRITLANIKNYNDTRTVTPYTFNFTTKGKYYINEDYESDDINPVGPVGVNATNGSVARNGINYNITAPANIAADAAIQIVEDSTNSNKYLRVQTGTQKNSTSGTPAIRASLDFTGGVANGGIKSSFIFDADMRIEQANTPINMGQIEGAKWANMYQTVKGTTDFYANGYLNSTQSAPTNYNLIHGINNSIFYKLRLVYLVNKDGNFLIDAYKNDGNGYKLIVEGFRIGKADTDLSNRIDALKMFALNYASENTSDIGIADYDNVKVYDYAPVQLISSSIHNLQSSVSLNTSTVTLRFSTPMDVSSLAGKFSLQDVDQSIVTPLSGTYNDAENSYVLTIPQGTLSGDKRYNLNIGQIFSADGFKYTGDSVISFNTSTNPAPIQLSGPVTFSATDNGSTINSILGETSVYVQIPITKIATGNLNITAALALFDAAGQLQALTTKDYTNISTGTLTGLGLDNIAPQYGWYAKEYVWDSLEGMQPMFGATEIKASADLDLPTLFTDNMVLQRGNQIPVWGDGIKGQTVTVTLTNNDNSTVSTNNQTTAANDGTWAVNLDGASLQTGGPYTMTVVNGDKNKTIRNILIGDVWLCSGQSNMLRSMGDEENATYNIRDDPDYVNMIKNEIQNPYTNNLRFYQISATEEPYPANDIANASWQISNSTSVIKSSAIGYFLGKKLQQDENVPIGIIQSAVGGTRIEQWMSKSTTDTLTHPISTGKPNTLYNGMIAPLQRYPIKGVAWYQGESNYDVPASYAEFFPAFIQSWRDEWHNQNLPFAYVQLAAYQPYDFTGIWDTQLQTLKSMNNVGMASAADLGLIDQIHPPHKDMVAQRLGLVVEKLAYSATGEYMGPIVDSVAVSGTTATITFNNVGTGLKLKDGTTTLTGFKILDGTGNLTAVTGTINGTNQVNVSLGGITNPTAIEYCFESWPAFTLYNSIDLPASPFTVNLK